MKAELSPAQLEAESYLIWKTRYALTFAESEIDGPILEKMRKGLYLDFKRMAECIGVTGTTYSRLEKREIKGDVTIKELRATAELMDFQFSYRLTTKDKQPISKRIWDRLYRDVVKIANHRKEILNPDRAAHLASILASDAEYRRRRGWDIKAEFLGSPTERNLYRQYLRWLPYDS